MKLKIDLATAKTRYPVEVAEVMKKLGSGKSRHKNAAPEELTWSLSWCVGIRAYSFNEMISGKIAEDRENRPKTEDAAVVDYAKRARVSLEGTVGRWWGSAGAGKLPFPKEIEELVRKTFREEEAEKKRVAALSPAEKQAEIDAALKQLSKSPGFIGFNVPRSE